MFLRNWNDAAMHVCTVSVERASQSFNINGSVELWRDKHHQIVPVRKGWHVRGIVPGRDELEFVRHSAHLPKRALSIRLRRFKVLHVRNVNVPETAIVLRLREQLNRGQELVTIVTSGRRFKQLCHEVRQSFISQESTL